MQQSDNLIGTLACVVHPICPEMLLRLSSIYFPVSTGGRVSSMRIPIFHPSLSTNQSSMLTATQPQTSQTPRTSPTILGPTPVILPITRSSLPSPKCSTSTSYTFRPAKSSSPRTSREKKPREEEKTFGVVKPTQPPGSARTNNSNSPKRIEGSLTLAEVAMQLRWRSRV